MNKNAKSLADKIAGVLSAAPTSFDPEDEAVDETTARLDTENEQDENEEEEQILSKFRKQNIDLLADVDEKYSGKRASRKSLRDSDDEDSLDSQEESDMEADLSDDEVEADVNNSEMDSDSNMEKSEDDSEVDEEESDEDGDDFNEDKLSEDDNDNDDNSDFKHVSDTNVSGQLKKAISVRNQMAIWENLLETRIQLQKCLVVANKMPQPETFKEIKAESGSQFVDKVSETKNNISNVLDKLMLLQKLVQSKFPETKNLHKAEKTEESASKSNDEEDDEEIPSDTESEAEEKEDEQVKIVDEKRKRKLRDYETDIEKHHKKYKDYRNKVIQKWNDKTRLVLKDGATSHSVLNQIEFNLSNKEKLIKRTQLKRSQYNIVGEKRQVEEENTSDNKRGEEYNSEIYDDDDFYHQLLRELIGAKSADITDPIQLGRQWIQLQSMRNKMKRKIDTKATKGRKIRYAVHSKLVNYMAPMDEHQWTDEAKSELYNSLFGKNQPLFSV